MSSNDLLDELIKAKESKNPLKQEILMARSFVDSIYVFEGVDDFPVYDEWLKHNRHYANSCHIVAKGKKQITTLYEYSTLIDDREILDNCIFYVDHDYDLERHDDHCITTLDCYSIENYIVNEAAVSNYMSDELRLDAKHITLKNSLMSDFRSDLSIFLAAARSICKPLFINHNILGKAEFYEKISKLINIEYKNIFIKENADIKGYLVDVGSSRFSELSDIFDNLTDSRAVRGKYVFEFIKLWLNSLKENLISRGNGEIKLSKKDPLMLEMRRLASSTPIPIEIQRSLR
ncbi:hypothetical protein OA48_08360 [Klebsiella variicola]|uniref:DUF4435 domain-containing protein n=2 Tax=Klebsiella variicola TaxID=244366 RepID=UPI00062C1C1D|nr:DUF4435 domain-containing protein [Klebsiella variicola]HBS7606393.1 DUF4435 domain-containing protein [Klebsiella pneumoniae]HBZ7345681.1 DUF4435 domain-containing protein [Klebsiella variicola subsp. variicola]KKY94576.1 hypothetical protein OA48_08360 [Klebsiella variicola]MCJ5187859.1 DUF4435 domain-containing protein [Klebsiella variicola]MCY7265233.1 DUF4435 domain-containing protein [Klebsiella variicola]